jgi:hypothetical protein
MSLDEPRGTYVAPVPVMTGGLSDEERALVLAHRQGWLGPGQPAPPQRSLLRLLLGVIGATIGLLLIVVLVVVLVSLVQVVTVTNQTAGSLSERASQAAATTGRTLAGVAQDLADRLDPSHPPRVALTQDTEFETLRLARPGDTLGETGEYEFVLTGIRRRDGATTPDTAQYAVVTRRYRVPRETKLLGLTVRVDRGETEHYLDRGESFRIGQSLYKVNWVSPERDQVAVAQYRPPAPVGTPLDFTYD